MLRFLKGTDWSLFADLVSPAFFQVLPGAVLREEVGRLFGSLRDARGFAAFREARAADAGAVAGVRWLAAGEKLPRPSPEAAPLDAAAAGQVALRLYFRQLLAWDTVAVDLRRGAFAHAPAAEGVAASWAPKSLWTRWDPAFLAGLRAMYRGFYDGDDARFRSGLDAIGLGAAEDIFRRTFGSGDQRSVRFSLRAFQETFHGVFVRCREAGARLPGGVLPLGLTLGSLYEHLEALGGEHDVRAAFAAVAG